MPDARRIIEVLINTKFDGKGLQQAGRDLSSITGLVQGISRGLITGGAAVVGTLTGMAVASGRAADQMRDLSIRSGVQVDVLSELGYAAGQSGTNVQELADGLKFLNRNADEAARGSDEAAKKFARIGVSVTDSNGKLKDSKTLLFETSDGLKAMTNDGERAAATLDLFGRSGDRLTEFLGLGSAGIRNMITDAQKLGVTVSPLVAKKADDFGDALGRTKAATGGLGLTIASVLLPKLTTMADKLTEVVVAGSKFIQQNPELVSAAAKYGAVAVAGGAALGVVANIATAISGTRDLVLSVAGPAKALMAILSNGGAAANLAKIVSLLGLAAGAAGAIVIPAAISGANKRTKENREAGINANYDDPEIRSSLDARTALLQENANYPGEVTKAKNKELIGELNKLIDKRLELLDVERQLAEVNKQKAGSDEADFIHSAVAAGEQAARDLEARAKAAGNSPAAQFELETLAADLAKLNQEADRFTLPAKIRDLQVALAIQRRSPSDLELLRKEGRRQFEESGRVDPNLIGALEQNRQADASDRFIDRPGIKQRPGKDAFGRSPEANLPDLQPIDLSSQPIPELGRPGTDAAGNVKIVTDELKEVGDVGTAVAQSLASSFSSWLHTIVETGEGLEDLGKILLKSLAFTGIDLLTGGIFGGLKSLVGGIFGGFAAEGAYVGPSGRIQAFAQGGITAGKRGHTDSVLAALSPGEIVLPPTLSKIFSNLAGLDQPSMAANIGGGSRSYNINVSPLTGSHHEALEFARRIRHALRELDGEFVR